jgi:hypothetical protein
MSSRLPCIVLFAVAASASPTRARADRMDRLVQILRTDPSFKVRLRVVIVLGRLKDRRAVPALVGALSDRSHLVRGLAAAALARIGDPQALPALRATTKDERHPFARKRQRGAIRKLVRLARARRKARFYVTVGKLYNRSRNGGNQAVRLLERALLQEFGRVRGVTTRWDGRRPRADELQDREMKGFMLNGGILRLTRRRTGGDVEVSCSLKVSLDTYPGNSMKAVYSGEASVAVASRSTRPELEQALYRDLFAGAAREARQHIVSSYLSKQ